MKKAFPLILVLVIIASAIWFLERKKQNTDIVLTTGETVTTGILVSEESVGRKVGDRAPNWRLETFEGDSIELAELRGKPVVLDFFADWCPFCHEEFPFIEAAHKKYIEEVHFIGIHRTDTESKEKGEQFARDEAGATFTLVQDTSGDVYGAYTTGRAMPISFFIDADGVIQKTILGPKTEKDLEEGIALLSN